MVGGLTGSAAIRKTAANTVSFDTQIPNGGLNSITGALSASQYNHVMGVIRRSPETGEVVKSFYINGVLASSAATNVDPTPFIRFEVGHQNSSAYFDGPIDHLVLLPYAASAAHVAAIAATFYATSFPRVIVAGDALPQLANGLIPVLAEGTTESHDFLAAGTGSGGLRNNMRRVSFDLMEV